MLVPSLLLAWASLTGCLVVLDDGVEYDCACDVVFDDYYYYGLSDAYAFSTCDPANRLGGVTDRVALDCVDLYSDGGYYYAACDCTCSETLRPC